MVSHLLLLLFFSNCKLPEIFKFLEMSVSQVSQTASFIRISCIYWRIGIIRWCAWRREVVWMWIQKGVSIVGDGLSLSSDGSKQGGSSSSKSFDEAYYNHY